MALTIGKKQKAKAILVLTKAMQTLPLRRCAAFLHNVVVASLEPQRYIM